MTAEIAASLRALMDGLREIGETPWANGPAVLALAEGLREARERGQAQVREALDASFGRVAPFISDYRKLLADPTRFSVFSVLRLSRREYVHSNVLAWLLDPMREHGLGDRFLNRVLVAAHLPELRRGQRCRVAREWVGAESIIDVLVETPDALLFLENKVDSQEGAEQTSREYRDLEAAAGGRRFQGVLLSPTGTLPTEERFVAWSYRKILDMIERTMKKEEPTPSGSGTDYFVRFLRDYCRQIRFGDET